MVQPLLTIQIPYTDERQNDFDRLFVEIGKQTNECKAHFDIEIQWDRTGKEMTIGEKRERLYKKAKGLFVWQIDSDDWIAPDAIELILEAIKSNPEIPVITFKEKCVINVEYKSSNHSIKYEKWQDNFDGYDYVRCPFYKDVIRTDLAKQVPFEHIRWNEDERWSYAIKHLLTDEIYIDQELYHYIHNSTNPTERYGLDRSS